MKYNIITISIVDYLKYHWERTKVARRNLIMTETEWRWIWEKNYWIEYANALEKELDKIKIQLQTVLREKSDEI